MKFLYKVMVFLYNKITVTFSNLIAPLYFSLNNVSLKKGLECNGLPIFSVQGKFTIEENFHNNNKILSNPIGRSYRSMFIVRKDAELTIGKNNGFSGVSIVCQKRITIGNNVKIGANTCIYDTDFHSLNYNDRLDSKMDSKNTIKKEIFIDDNVFIGAHSTILKGVKIGKNSIIGACSVVTKSVPDNEIWAGNPAKFVRLINDTK